jgi:hypothetical protein
VDRTINDGSRIARLPPVLRPLAVLARHVAHTIRPPATAWPYEADGLATIHYSPFIDDPIWQAAYDRMAETWFTEMRKELRWRMWTLTEHAKRVDGLGAFAEFGVYRGGMMYMVLTTTSRSRCHLFDTFAGIPDTDLTATERALGFAGRLDNTSVDYVREVLAAWDGRTVFHVGDVFDTLPRVDTGPLAFAHIDLNAARPTTRALEYVYPRLVSGGTIVFDDYGFAGYEDQRQAVDAFFADKREAPIAQPTGQAILIKT